MSAFGMALALLCSVLALGALTGTVLWHMLLYMDREQQQVYERRVRELQARILSMERTQVERRPATHVSSTRVPTETD